MTLQALADRINELLAKKPKLANKDLALNGETLEIAEFIEDEEASEDNDWCPSGHWKHGEFIALLEVEE